MHYRLKVLLTILFPFSMKFRKKVNIKANNSIVPELPQEYID